MNSSSPRPEFSSYLAVAFRHEPLEIWDIKSMRLLRRMSKRCPIIVDVVSGRESRR